MSKFIYEITSLVSDNFRKYFHEVISSFMYGGVTKVHAEEIDGATQLDAGEQGDQVDAPENVEQVNEEALPEAEVPEEELEDAVAQALDVLDQEQ